MIIWEIELEKNIACYKKKVYDSRSNYSTKGHNTVDGRNPAPPDMYETLSMMGYLP